MSIKSKRLYNKIKRNNPYFEDFITRSIYNSNAIEGNTMSYYDTYAIVFNDDTIIHARPRELHEVINLKCAFDYMLMTLEENISINRIMIIKIGKCINKSINDISGFRQVQVYIRGTRHIPPAPSEVPRLVSELIYKSKKSEYNLVYEYLADFHLKFECIHPFVDGNGRTGRLLLTKLALQSGIAPIIIPVELRSEYMKLLEDRNVNGLASMFEKLSKFEEQRMEEFGIKI